MTIEIPGRYVALSPGITYRARLDLSGTWYFAGADDVKKSLEDKGFSNVVAWESPPSDWPLDERQSTGWYVQGTWNKAPGTFDREAESRANWQAVWVHNVAAPSIPIQPPPVPIPNVVKPIPKIPTSPKQVPKQDTSDTSIHAVIFTFGLGLALLVKSIRK